MPRKLTANLLIASICFLISVTSACTKDDAPPPPPPVLLDTLGPGWQKIKIDSIPYQDIFFTSNQLGFICGPNYVGKSTDGGLTWRKVIPDALNEQFINIFFLDNNNGWVTGLNFLIRTRDGGSTWEKVYSGAGTFDVQFWDANNGFITSENRGLLKTVDGGVTAQLVNPLSVSGMFFQSPDKGWVSQHAVFKTENGGTDLTKVVNIPDLSFYAIQFTDALHGWLAGASGTYRTEDGGQNFQQIFSGQQSGDIHFFDNNNGYLMSDSKIYRTTDGGKTHTQLCSLQKGQVIEIHFTDLNHGWAIGSSGYVYIFVKP